MTLPTPKVQFSGRSAALVVAIAICTGACSSRGSGDWQSLFVAGRTLWHPHVSAITQRQALALHRATIGVRVGDSAEQLLSLAGDQSSEDQLWASAARLAITTRHGRIVRTSGLDHDLAGFSTVQNSPVNRPNASWERRHAFQWVADFPDLGVYSVAISCEDVPRRQETIAIFGRSVRVSRVDETCRCPSLDWSFSNIFWVSPSGELVWRSIQHIHPGLDPLRLEVIRAPR